ncbi:ATP phosphoribosyltransferase regulatory subunit [Helicobacter fennelliae]|uniref:ATP phosphoribosyltransferase regulatory subunit, divergent variant n=2 Tax=Helicobacter fennelliae TaxID=215 RepID=T1CSM7_9HELI|nr:ATP phosphoribosyltransferase regulatory subunit [Helicobacter fennelliae]GAD19819.1 ATP phosphoribosyltransferase regulatory subunit, divergent variant [Helicobacter fennelliae MRY12-0050]SQB98648.1 ATP phosphoribosyltransferase [Helicobacter fennelliae]STP07989.1 ATP phosphoribosyltransferase [Helicobacter fennelliae]STQ84102.1 ATP phosphoribosyltransferase [Helicobacter fennelliae]
MVFEHEIPQGTKLHFGKSARLKRNIENKACEIFYHNGFEEIITPSFSYFEHQQNFSNRHIIRLSSQNNHQISLRYDSTIDTIRIITKRLGRSTNHQKWFYIQPVFSYPTSEIYQIGAECLDMNELSTIINVGLEILSSFILDAYLQISNAKILHLCINEIGLNIESYNALCVQEVEQKALFMKQILEVNDIESLERFLSIAPMFLRFEVERLIESAKMCKHNRIIIAPLAKPVVDYYDDMVFKVFNANHTLMLGGNYNLQGYECCGFGIYTDNVVDLILQES